MGTIYRTLITHDRLEAMAEIAAKVPKKGFFAECGVFRGGSLHYLAERFPHKDIIGFDTFEGLPRSQWKRTEKHRIGEFHETTLHQVADYLKEYPKVKLVKGVFPETAKPWFKTRFSFVHVDFDFEVGTRLALEWFWPRLKRYGAIVFDDYKWPNCPGVEKVLEKFSNTYGVEVKQTVPWQAVIWKKQ